LNAKQKWLISWIGESDHRAAEGTLTDGDGPIANALLGNAHYDRVFLLTNYPHVRSEAFCNWLEKKANYKEIDLQDIDLSSPTNYAEIYKNVCDTLLAIKLPRTDVDLSFHLSPGTPAMAAIWIMLAKTRFPATLLQSTKSNSPSNDGCFQVETIDFSFDLANDFLPEYLQRSDDRIERLSDSLPKSPPEFEKIIHQSQVMAEQIDLARRIAAHDVPVLILGETGTGKELFAEAIAKASRRKEKPFIAINCGAISKDLINSELFGHKKGSFTGADSHRKGLFQEANNGTLFLDEIGDLPLDAQVKLLRTLQEGKVTPVGENSAIKVDVRIIAATHKDLMHEVSIGNFREDLFHRLAVGILQLPPLRERKGDISLLIDHSMERINSDAKDQPEWQNKIISPNIKKILIEYPWPGNVRELHHTLLRASIWSKQVEISELDLKRNLLTLSKQTDSILDQNLNDGFELQILLDKVERHYIQKAIQNASGTKKRAAELLGFTNYQTLTNRMARLGIIFDNCDN
jgi:DNA-binding NtrC family response regulator